MVDKPIPLITDDNDLAYRDLLEARTLCDHLKLEIESLRETNRSLHRRCQFAESVANRTIDECRRAGVSLGRAFLGYDNSRLRADVKALRELIERRYQDVRGTTSYASPDELIELNTLDWVTARMDELETMKDRA